MELQQILAAIQADPRYRQNLAWGEPRSGHPEGSVQAHITELEHNLERLQPRLTPYECEKLRILIHTHDTFKAEAVPGVAILHQRSHASLARAYLQEYCEDADLLAMVQYHDEPFAMYQQYAGKGRYNQARMDALRQAIQDWELFLAFLIIDGCTAGKSRKPLRWFFQEISEWANARFTTADILE